MTRPSEVSEYAWMQMDDYERMRVIDHCAREWYERVGQFMSDPEWVEMLTK